VTWLLPNVISMHLSFRYTRAVQSDSGTCVAR